MASDEQANVPPPSKGDGANEPAYGKRTLPQTLDLLAQTDPERLWGCIANSPDLSQGFTEVKMGDMAEAVHYSAGWLEARIGQGRDFETLAIMEIADFRYPLLFLAAVKLGYKLLALSPRNSAWMNGSLLEQLQCVKVLVPCGTDAIRSKLPKETTGVSLVEVPSFGELMGHKPSKRYAFEKTWDEAKWDPVLVLHSSGSTGPPKPIVLNHGAFSSLDNERNLPPVPGRKIQSTALFNFPDHGYYYASPLASHLSGFLSMIEIPIFSTTATVVLGPPGMTPTGKLLRALMNYYPLRGTFANPNIVEELLLEPDGLAQAATFDFLLFMGGPLPPAAGDRLSRVVPLCQFYGSTELLEIATLVPAPEDWPYVEFHPSVEADMQPATAAGAAGVHELVFHRNARPHSPRFGLDWTYPDVAQWRTRDLFRPNPKKSRLWQFAGRADDLLVLGTGSKFHPVPSEMAIAGSPLLRGAVVIGEGRPHAGLLVEAQEGIEREGLVQRIWPVVQAANEAADTVARVEKAWIVVATPAKPFVRTEKGTIVRKTTVDMYKEEIEELYAV